MQSQSEPLRERYRETPEFKFACRQIDWLLLRLMVKKIAAIPFAEMYHRLVGNHPLIMGDYEITIRKRGEPDPNFDHVTGLTAFAEPVTEDTLAELAHRAAMGIPDPLRSCAGHVSLHGESVLDEFKRRSAETAENLEQRRSRSIPVSNHNPLLSIEPAETAVPDGEDAFGYLADRS